MRSNIKKLVAASALGLVTILGTSEIVSAQGKHDRRDDQKQDRKAYKEQEKVRKQNSKIELERQAEWNKQNDRIQNDQRRTYDRNGRITASGNDRSNGQGYYNGNANAHTNRNNRYRVYRNGSYYNTDQRGADLLRQAVNEGYRQGFSAGRSDLDGRRRISYSNSNVYQSGTYGYQSYVSQSQYQYYFRQGFQRGYQDGANTRYRDNNNNYGQYNDGYNQNNDYNQQYQYGSRSNGVLSILGQILGQILNIQNY